MPNGRTTSRDLMAATNVDIQSKLAILTSCTLIVVGALFPEVTNFHVVSKSYKLKKKFVIWSPKTWRSLYKWKKFNHVNALVKYNLNFIFLSLQIRNYFLFMFTRIVWRSSHSLSLSDLLVCVTLLDRKYFGHFEIYNTYIPYIC